MRRGGGRYPFQSLTPRISQKTKIIPSNKTNFHVSELIRRRDVLSINEQNGEKHSLVKFEGGRVIRSF